MKRILSILLATAVVTTVAPFAHAVCFEPKLRIDDEYFASDLVFSGTIIRDQKVGLTPDGGYDGHVFSWRVERAFRGSIKPGEIVRTSSDNGSGRFPNEAEDGHQVGRKFLVFAFADPSHKDHFYIENCGNSEVLSKASRTIAELTQLPRRHGGLLYGEMFDGDIGVQIVATGSDGQQYSDVSNGHGKFAISLPPGTYSVKATAPGRIYDDFELSYKRSQRVVVPDGGSAGLAFREKGWDGKKLPYVAP